MSGPKASDYTLEQRRQERLQRAQEAERRRREAIRQAEEEERRRREAERRRREAEIRRALEEERRRQEEIRRNTEAITQGIQQANAIVARTREMMKKQMMRMAGMGLQADRKKMEDMEKRLEALRKAYSNPRDAAERRGSSAVAECQSACDAILHLAGDLSAQSQMMEAQIANKTADQARQELERILARAKKEKEERQQAQEKKRQEIVQQVENLAAQIQEEFDEMSGCLPADGIREMEDFRKQLHEILENQNQMPEMQLGQLHNFQKIARARLKKQEARWKEIAQLQNQYAVLCDMLGRSAGVLSQDPAELTDLCQQASKELENRAIRQQVETALQECMEEMGYSLLGKRKIDGMANDAMECSDMLYHMHGQTVLHVTHSSTGQIAMEIGLGEERHRAMQESEVNELVQDMVSFCGDYNELQRRLRDKGVVVQQEILRCPAAAEFAHTIDMTEFDVSADAMQHETEVAGQTAAVVQYQFMDQEER